MRKAIVKPESMSIINEISKPVGNPGTKVAGDRGHTDSDGDDAANLKLSAQRAEAVKPLLIAAGVKETQPPQRVMVSPAPSPVIATTEGKASNRRVEFTGIKIAGRGLGDRIRYAPLPPEDYGHTG